ncbi:carbamoyl-phosphate synthase large subunit [Legionella pneumophila]|uniref:carbamoyl-phosphate synthase large subunit n=1 Tax=Legionella pneumophila TaxID=446 RepID=UPI000770A1AD|nr:carbamoyl-phosphate synthase large subunit [Legionella pneumophila]CZH14721.1 Carbamoyl-phosphate synthase large chain [Legionella pneumophila]HAT1981716.1 carbamoyl-phosphate synthase large subunit [Legionella pneumophila]HAT4423910.1 carbamoyl-phosphate synthase large subunit [Legionella pneumophila]HAU1721305.1 carbamoyl-phosphate synthase large subunit [Legionella pneumophila]
MPKRTDIKSILILGAGPIVIGQACEFDYSGTQAVRALKEEGYRVILVNSNPATIMTDPELADATYIEPVQWKEVARIIEIERPDALLPTMGGQTALNCALDLVREGVLAKYSVEMIGATREAIDRAEDREKFRQLMIKIGLDMPRSAIAHSLEEAIQVQARLGFPAIIRPSFTMGGSGGGIAYNREEFEEICIRGLELSPTRELLIDESVLGWKEYEMEVVRDKNDNCIIVCTIENFDPMGVHTGDSITVAPAQTLTDKEYQRMRDAAIKVLRAVGVDTGGSNVQFAINPEDGRMLVVEMNPRVSRSSALASKATGFPIAKVAAKLAVGYTLDELKNEITGGKTPASFEPSIDYVVTKVPRFNFDKFPQTPDTLTTQMKSVGEVMAIGSNFQESLQKAIRGLEIGRCGLHSLFQKEDMARLRGHLREPTPDRLWYIADAFRQNLSLEEIHLESRVDPWFLAQIQELVLLERSIIGKTIRDLDKTTLHLMKHRGFADAYLAKLLGCTEAEVRARRVELEILPVYKRIDSCAGEFPSDTAYMYSCYEGSCEARPESNKKKIMILGGGPNRIGQGIEFDYCCVHAALSLRSAGYQTIMVNCNPETVSTDFDTSDRLYFEPVTLEDVLSIVAMEQPEGVIVHYGGQTPLKLARDLEANGVKIIGTSSDAIDMAEDRERFQQMVKELKLHQPDNGTVRSEAEAIELANKIGYPLVVRPSYVLGGRAMEIVYQEEDLRYYLSHAVEVSNDSPVLLDKFLNDAIEVDIDAVCDGKDVLIGAIMEHIEQAGIHSGDSACTLPPFSLGVVVQQDLIEQIRKMALKLGVVGLINAQFAIQADDIYVLEVNPRASRTVPFVSKATGLPLAKIAALCKVGIGLKDQGLNQNHHAPSFYSIKLPVFPFIKFSGVDSILGPEMKSTGEVMGIAKRFGQAYAKAQLGAGCHIAKRRRAFVSVRDADKTRVGEIAKRLIELGFEIIATRGTALALQAAGVDCRRVFKVAEGRPHVLDFIKNNEIDFIVNTTEGKQAIADSFAIRRNALQHKVSYTTTLSGAEAACLAMKYEDRETVTRLQDLH